VIPQDKWPSFRSAHDSEETSFTVQDPDDDGCSYEVGCVTIGGDEKNEEEENEDQDTDF